MTTACDQQIEQESEESSESRVAGFSPHSYCGHRVRIRTRAFEGTEPTYIALGAQTQTAGTSIVEHRPFDSDQAEHFYWDVECPSGAPLYFRSAAAGEDGQARSWMSRPDGARDGDIIARALTTSVDGVGDRQAFLVNIIDHGCNGFGISALGGGHSLWAADNGSISFSTTPHDVQRQVFQFSLATEP